jgi:hypothetical protein
MSRARTCRVALPVIRLQLDIPAIARASGRDQPGAGEDVRAPCLRVHGIEHNQTRIIDPAIGVLEGFRELLLERASGRVGLQIQDPGAGQDLAPAEMVIEKQAKAQQPCRPHALVVRQHESASAR